MKKGVGVFILPFVLSASLYAKHIVIDLSSQKLTLINHGDVLLNARVSTGNKFHPTPSGVFKVVLKKRHHKSTLYPIRENGRNGGAPMNYMLRFNGPIAMHKGFVPMERGKSIPVSHGCVRLNSKDAKKLFSLVDVGTSVIVKGKANYNNSFNKRLIDSEKLEDGYAYNGSNLNLTINNQDIEELEF